MCAAEKLLLSPSLHIYIYIYLLLLLHIMISVSCTTTRALVVALDKKDSHSRVPPSTQSFKKNTKKICHSSYIF